MGEDDVSVSSLGRLSRNLRNALPQTSPHALDSCLVTCKAREKERETEREGEGDRERLRGRQKEREREREKERERKRERGRGKEREREQHAAQPLVCLSQLLK